METLQRNKMSIMTDDEFILFRDLISKECGIFLKEGKKDFLRSRIEKRLLSANMGSFFQYYKYISNDNDELTAFLDDITINETYFFRNTNQFDMLREKILPEIIDKKRRQMDYNLRIWSAGCATGEEAYSLAIEVSEALHDLPFWNVFIMASDISWRCLNRGIKSLYPKDKLASVPEKYIEKYFNKKEDCYELKNNVKKLVLFDFHNLCQESGLKNIDIIFCRNVMIYFDLEEQRQLISRLSRALKVGGYLFLGHAESLRDMMSNGDFRLICWNKGAAYQKTEEHA